MGRPASDDPELKKLTPILNECWKFYINNLDISDTNEEYDRLVAESRQIWIKAAGNVVIEYFITGILEDIQRRASGEQAARERRIGGEEQVRNRREAVA